MREKDHFAIVLPLVLAFGALAGSVFGDTGALLKEADGYYQKGDYEAAEKLYQAVAVEAPGSEDAFAAERKLICLYCAEDKEAEAQAGVETMLAGFSAHERLPHAVHEVADECHRLGKGGRIRAVYQQILDTQPLNRHRIWLEMGVAISNILSGVEGGAETVIERLTGRFSADGRCAEALSQIGWSYRDLKKYKDARRVYRYVVENWPGGPRVIYAQRDLVRTCIAMGDDPNAAAGAGKLAKDFAGDERLAGAIAKVAEAYRDAKKYKEARTWHRYILEKHRSSAEAIWSQRGVILTSIELKDDPNTTGGIEKLLAEYAGHKDIARVVYQVGRKLNYRNDAKAQELYEYVRDRHPSSEYAALSRVNIGNMLLGGGDEEAAREIFDGVMADFKDHPILPKAIALVAEAYLEQGRFDYMYERDEQAYAHYRAALAEFQRIIDEFPEIPFTTPWAYFHAAECYLKLGDRQKAIEYRQKVADDWLDFRYARLARETAEGLRKEAAAMREQTKQPPPPLRFWPGKAAEQEK